jgi:hypothetical protein
MDLSTDIQELKQFLSKNFEMKDLGPLSYSLIYFLRPISQTVRLQYTD